MREDYYIHQQLEPTDILITGNAKRWGLLPLPERKRILDVSLPQPYESEQENNERQDDYLKSKGIN